MREYTGQLIGGPDNGNYISASVDSITVVSTIELWLDGDDADKDVSISEVKGVYTWNPEMGIFAWNLKSSKVFTKKVERV